MRTLLTIVTLSALFAGTSAFSADYKQFYIVNGKEVTAETAILSAVKGNEAFKCVSVEAKLSKSQTSIGLRNVKKKPKSE